MARKRSSVKPATFALALSTVGPSSVARLETPTNADNEPRARVAFSSAPHRAIRPTAYSHLYCASLGCRYNTTLTELIERGVFDTNTMEQQRAVKD